MLRKLLTVLFGGLLYSAGLEASRSEENSLENIMQKHNHNVIFDDYSFGSILND